ncbi:ABC transporter substrate-binding protein [Nitratireductor basaltis]|uniref:Extracellular solute-binding protein, family 5 n=1 Tax=Nitratireductor basaltis TaxID=472175 RepID=A0A084U567_9HYPH|nr:ABC transporter substrate-binding protein [Nitratireductor basaltis]KFB08103.1 Extracellular solute-binding protein, family 5 precursor [Nitratireductor basaltis]
MRIRTALLAATCAMIFAQPLGAKELLTIDLVNEPTTLDPHMQWNPDSYYVYRNIFDNIVTRDNDGKIVPQVAESWEQISDTELALTIREGIKFHDGSDLTAEDVAFSVKRIIDPEFASPQLGQFNKITDARVEGDNKVVLVTDGPYPALLAQLVKLSVVPKAVVEEAGKDGFNANPVGSGPYKFGEQQRGVSVTLVRNDDYWGEKGEFEEAVFRAVPDAATRVANLKAGTSDLVVSLDSDLALQLENDPQVQLLTALTERVGFMGINTTREPLDDPELRKALAMAIDREGIVEGILGGGEKVVSQMATSAHFGYVEGIEPIPYDPEQAKQIVEAAGDAAKTKMEFATAPVFDQRIVQAIQQMLNDVGFNVEINMSDMATYLKTVQQPEQGSRPYLSFGRWSCACQDVDGVLFPLLHSGSNWSRVSSETIDEALETGRSSLDEQERLDAYKTVHQLVHDETLILPLYQAAALYGGAAELEWEPTANESLFLNRMSWKEQE